MEYYSYLRSEKRPESISVYSLYTFPWGIEWKPGRYLSVPVWIGALILYRHLDHDMDENRESCGWSGGGPHWLINCSFLVALDQNTEAYSREKSERENKTVPRYQGIWKRG